MDFFPWIIIGVLLVVWNIAITVLLINQRNSFKKITKGGKSNSIIDLLAEVVENEKKAQKIVAEIDNKVEDLIFNSQFYIQKIGLVRFNPFNDTGGDQSFILALIDEKDSGVVVSGLHTRNGTRWYAKEIHNGKGVDHELSDDELKAIKSAKKRAKK